jgi:hypothetical protein
MNKVYLSKERNMEMKYYPTTNDQKQFQRIVDTSHLSHERHGIHIDNLLNTQSILDGAHNTVNKSSTGLQMPQTSPYINQSRPQRVPSNLFPQRYHMLNQQKKSDYKSNSYLLTPEQNHRCDLASQGSLGSRQKMPINLNGPMKAVA